jgi:hypothetical protein
MTIEHEQDGEDIDTAVIDAAYNHHVHTQGCFRTKANAKPSEKKRKRASHEDECRYRFPACKRRQSKVRDATETPVKWFRWDGSFMVRHLKEVTVKRCAYDTFQNVWCPAITHSKISCNSNISLIPRGPNGEYTFHYAFKDTQKDDSSPYKDVAQALQRVLNRGAAMANTTPNCSRAISTLLAASFANKPGDVLHGTMATFLIRRKSRFMFSHTSAWCPLQDLHQILIGENVYSSIN